MTRSLAFIMFVLCLALALARPASAQSTTPMFSLWADDEMTCCDVYPGGPYQPFNVYVFLHPGSDGAFAAEYKLTALPGHFSVANVKNTFVSPAALGLWLGAPGISVGFTSCQSTVVWIINLTMMAPNTTPGYYVLEQNDDTDFLGVAICPEPRPMVAGIVYNYLGYYAPCTA